MDKSQEGFLLGFLFPLLRSHKKKALKWKKPFFFFLQEVPAENANVRGKRPKPSSYNFCMVDENLKSL